MAILNDTLKRLIDKTQSGELEWVPTEEHRWNASMAGCRFSLMQNAIDIDDGKTGGWYRHTLPVELASDLLKLVESRFPTKDRSDEVLANALKCLTDD